MTSRAAANGSFGFIWADFFNFLSNFHNFPFELSYFCSRFQLCPKLHNSSRKGKNETTRPGVETTTLVHQPAREHRVLDVQRLTPRPEPVDVLGGLGPELLRLVPGRGEGSAVRRVGAVTSARRVYRHGRPRCFPARRSSPLQRGARVQAHGESEVGLHDVAVVVVAVVSVFLQPCSR